MEAFIFFGGIAFVAGLIARSLFVTQRQPQVIYVQTEPVEHSGSGGCLPLILIGAVVLGVLLTISGA
jgi:hypothetical protein